MSKYFAGCFYWYLYILLKKNQKIYPVTLFGFKIFYYMNISSYKSAILSQFEFSYTNILSSIKSNYKIVNK